MALAFLRRHQRWFHVLLGLVILGFIVFYIPMFDTAVGGATEEVGRVGELPITAREFQTAYLRMRNRYERATQKPLDANMLRMLGLDRQVFDGLVEQRIVELEARRLGLTVSDRDLAQSVASMPFLQENGRFVGADAVKRWVDNQGMTISEFERVLRQDLLRKQLEALVTDGVTVTPNEIEQEFRRRNEEIKAEYVLVDSTSLQAAITPTDEEVRAHFEANKEQYRIPDKRVASYILVDPNALRAQVAVTDADVKGRYESQLSRFRDEEQACARHVLVKVKADDAPTGRTDEQAKKEADKVLAQLRAGGDFAAIAKKSSDDEGSAANGGDLGCFPRGTMVPEFENSAFNLEQGALSDPVKTQYGYHVIQLKELRKERVKPLDEVKESLRNELTTERAQAKAEQLSSAVAQALSSGRKLEEAASANGLPVQTSPPMARGEAVPPLSDEVVGRLFDLKVGETVPEPLPLPTGFIFVSLKAEEATRLPELAAAQDRVKVDVVQKKAAEQALAKAADLKGRAAGAGLAKAASSMGLTRKETPSVVRRGDPIGDIPAGAAVDEAAFSLPKGQLSDPIPVRNGYAVLRVTEKKEVDPAAFENEKVQLASTLRSTKRSQLFDAYLTQARQRFPVERRPEALRRFIG